MVSGKKEQITAIGLAMPPMVIFDGKHLTYQWTIGKVPGTYYGISNKGWTDQELFRYRLKDHFLKYAVGARPLLLYSMGTAHIEPESVEFAREEEVIIFCLPSHTTQDSQPLDCMVFGPLKRHWTDVCHDFQQHNLGGKLNFSALFAKTWLQALITANIIAGFKKCGFNSATGIEPTEQSSPATKDASVRANESTSWNAELFERRYNDGYDLYDPVYLTWLEFNHPDAVPTDRHSMETSMSLVDVFAHVAVVPPSADISPGGTSTAVNLSAPSTGVSLFAVVSPCGTSTAVNLSAPSTCLSLRSRLSLWYPHGR